MDLMIDIISWLVLAGGGVFILIGGLGALRLPNFYARMHAASLTDGMGTILVLTGIMLQAGWSLATVKLLSILVIMLLTSPTASYALANAALLSGMKPAGVEPEGKEP